MNVAIIGAGLIGASLGLALRSAEAATHVAIYDPSEQAREAARERAAADLFSTSIAEAVAGAAVIFVATPLEVIAEAVAEASKAAPEGAVLTDCGSTKARVVVESARRCAAGRRFVGGHPVAGSERAGAAAARPDLFAGAHWILTPQDPEDAAAVDLLAPLLGRIGARVVTLSPEEHDRVLAMLSHVPQLVSSALMAVAARRVEPAHLDLAGPGLRDTTRLAGSPSDLWLRIAAHNAEEIVPGLRAVSSLLEQVAAGLESGQAGPLEEALSQARAARLRLGDKPLHAPTATLTVSLPDQPGALAQVTAALADAAVNVEDVGLAHSVDGTRGILRLVVARGAAASAEVALARIGLDVDEI